MFDNKFFEGKDCFLNVDFNKMYKNEMNAYQKFWISLQLTVKISGRFISFAITKSSLIILSAHSRPYSVNNVSNDPPENLYQHIWCWTEGSVELKGEFNWEVCWTEGCVELRGVLNWGVFGVELRDFGCLKGVVLVLNWCVELRGSVWSWGVLVSGYMRIYTV